MNISEVLKSRKCMSCGNCSAICPVEAIQMIYNKKTGLYRPVLNQDKCVDCGLCGNTCPANHQSISSLLGNYKSIYLAHSTDTVVRNSSTSGGAINSLVRFLLDKKLADAILMTCYDKKSPIEASPVFITKDNVDMLIDNPRDFASRYVSVPVLSAMDKKNKYKRLAVVGTPCQMRALNLAGGSTNDLDIFKIGITCSGGISYKATEQFKRSQKMKISKVYYRGDGWPGKNSLVSEKRVINNNHQGSLFERMFSSQIFKNPGCRYCKDHFAENADISFCDFWDTKEMKNETEGNSCVIIRSVKAQKLFDALCQNKYIEVIREVSEAEIVKTQLNVLKAKKGNLCTKFQYKSYSRLCDFVFRHSLYKMFNYNIYRKCCTYYVKICKKSDI